MDRKLSRRQALAAFGTVSLGSVLAACGDDDPATSASGTTSTSVTTVAGTTATVQTKATSAATKELFDASATCSLTVEQTEGPYYFDAGSIRRDLREDRDGTLLRLALRVRDAEGCTPVENAVVDLWHCDAGGLYSGFEAASRGGGGGRDEETYLRGAQVTNADGIAEFLTVYPGWYPGRTVHVHAKVHLDRTTLLTTQLYFEDALTAAVHATAPYAAKGAPDTTNDADGIFDPSLVATGSRDAGGVLAVMTFDVRRA